MRLGKTGRLIAVMFGVTTAVAACDGANTGSDGGIDAEGIPVDTESLGILSCDTSVVAANPDKRCHTYRAVAGVSMGGGTASRLGFTYPELFDVVGVMGTPFSENEFFWGMVESNHLGGFCSLEQLESVMAEHGPESLADPTTPGAFCGTHDVWPLENGDQVSPGLLPAVEGSECWMFRSDYNHFYRGAPTGRGGSFTRSSIINILTDLVAAYGNPFYYNPDNPYLPPGVPSSWIVDPPSRPAEIETICANPVVLENVYNREFNPDGSYPVITYCDGNHDGEEESLKGTFDPSRPYQNVIDFLLAVDLNGNGKRDYAEPVLINNRERWLDVGVDGTADADEDGYDPELNPDPAGDNWDPLTNPAGTERNYRFDEGEPYDDDGLDGVPATMDYGEGNGIYDISPTLERIFDRSPARFFDAIDEAHLGRLDVWLDAGIRDFINSAQITNALYARIKDRIPDSRTFSDFDELPALDPDRGYVFYNADYSREAMGQVAYLQYGKTDVCPDSDNSSGEGNHVGPDIIHRLFTLFSFLSARIPAEGRDNSIGGNIGELEGPTGSIGDFSFMSSYHSEALGHEQPFGILLPPDYYLDRSKDVSYPVLYFFHGQGMSAESGVAIGTVLWGSMKEAATQSPRYADGKTDFQRAIIVWVDGECHGDECWTGTFYADFEGRPRPDRNYEQAFLELVRHVETNYRVKAPHLVEE